MRATWLLLAAGLLWGQGQQTIFQSVYIDQIVFPLNSSPVSNIGNSGHLIWVKLDARPTKTCGTPQTVNVGLEGSFDNATWSPIGAQLSSVAVDINGNLITTTTAQGAFPFARIAIRSFDNVNCKISVWYSGTVGSQNIVEVTNLAPPSGGGGTPPSSAVTVSKSQTFTSSGTWTRPTNVTNVWVTVCGAGGGGGGGGSTDVFMAGGGGGGGGECLVRFPLLVAGDLTVTIGAGGTAGVLDGAGGIGGTTSVGALIALGGTGGGGGQHTGGGGFIYGGQGGDSGGGAAGGSRGGGSGSCPVPGYGVAQLFNGFYNFGAGGNGGAADGSCAQGGGGGTGGVGMLSPLSYGKGGPGGNGNAVGTVGQAGVAIVEWLQ